MDHRSRRTAALQIELAEDIAEGVYTNLVMIAHNPEEFVLDFIRVLPGVPKARVKSRVVVTPGHAKRLLAALADNLHKYEAAVRRDRRAARGAAGHVHDPRRRGVGRGNSGSANGRRDASPTAVSPRPVARSHPIRSKPASAARRSGSTTEPSACCPFSSSAATMRGSASARAVERVDRLRLAAAARAGSGCRPGAPGTPRSWTRTTPRATGPGPRSTPRGRTSWPA